MSTPTSAHAGYTFITIDDPGASETQALGINDSGQVVGTASVPGAPPGFLDTAGVFTSVSNPGSSFPALPDGINNAGQIVGYYGGGADGFVDTGGSFAPISDPSATNGTFLNGINNSGVGVGTYYANGQHGFVVSILGFSTIDNPNAQIFGGGFGGTQATGVNDLDEVVGNYFTGGPSRGFLDNGGSFSDILDPNATGGTTVTGIDNNGDIVGYYVDSGGTHGFIDSNGVFTALDDPNGTGGSTFVTGINNNGEIVGNYSDANGADHGFVATLENSGTGGGGTGGSTGGTTSVPEPSSLALLLSGAAIFATRRRGRKPPQIGFIPHWKVCEPWRRNRCSKSLPPLLNPK